MMPQKVHQLLSIIINYLLSWQSARPFNIIRTTWIMVIYIISGKTLSAFMFWRNNQVFCHLHSMIVGLILRSDIDLFSEIKSVGNIWFSRQASQCFTRLIFSPRPLAYILKASSVAPTEPRKKLNFPQICPKMPRNVPKMAKNDPKWPKNGQKWPKWSKMGPKWP